MSSPANADELSRDDFATQVHDALAHLYDSVYLQTHPLVHMVCEERGIERVRGGEILRQSLIEAIERLRPNVD
ncbi:MAG TPA: hypothetical protein VMW65_16705, partial [Chloroflexota bacterium]|nr:hypothetical protein [Chloroflexota bacterium]